MRKFKHYTIKDVITGVITVTLSTLAFGSILLFIGLWIMGEISTPTSFGIYG